MKKFLTMLLVIATLSVALVLTGFVFGTFALFAIDLPGAQRNLTILAGGAVSIAFFVLSVRWILHGNPLKPLKPEK